jgi:hypothetical protein
MELAGFLRRYFTVTGPMTAGRFAGSGSRTAEMS